MNNANIEFFDIRNIHEMVLWTDNMRYVEDFLSSFDLPFVPVVQSKKMSKPHIALRHDVDWSIENALAMAILEAKENICSTYFLLHPDGYVQADNYFGEVKDNALEINPGIFEISKRLIDLGHEVALHNDLMTLALYTKRQPEEFLEQILEAFSVHGINIQGTVAHGSIKCHELGYVNFQMFADCASGNLKPPLSGSFKASTVEYDGFSLDKFTLKMSDFGLEYEGNFMPHEIKISDSGASWAIVNSGKVSKFNKLDDKEEVLTELQEALAGRSSESSIGCLVHPCHWSSMTNYNGGIAKQIIGKRGVNISVKKRAKKVIKIKREEIGYAKVAQQISDLPNVLYARHNPVFASYDQSYRKNKEHFIIPISIEKFTESFVQKHSGPTGNVLEVGCGQGYYLDFCRILFNQYHSNIHFNGIGIDGSISAIEGSARQFPKCFWASDIVESFLGSQLDDYVGQYPWMNNLDLVLDKTGTTFIKSFDVAETFFNNIIERMSPKGAYVFMASRNFYENKLMKSVYHEWDKHWMALAESKFSRVDVYDDDMPDLKGYYKRVYWRS
jgi:SAM-dependent methyltransferase